MDLNKKEEPLTENEWKSSLKAKLLFSLALNINIHLQKKTKDNSDTAKQKGKNVLWENGQG